MSALLVLVSFYMPYRQLLLSQQLPPIHDITTDIGSLPAFVAIARVRVFSHTPVSYDGPETAAQQRRAYPDIRTVTFARSPAEVFAEALQLVQELGWNLAEASQQEGRIEATVTSRWFGFKNDVVIRLALGPGGTTVFDMHSKSRVNFTDVGSNARHISEFITQLGERL